MPKIIFLFIAFILPLHLWAGGYDCKIGDILPYKKSDYDFKIKEGDPLKVRTYDKKPFFQLGALKLNDKQILIKSEPALFEDTAISIRRPDYSYHWILHLGAGFSGHFIVYSLNDHSTQKVAKVECKFSDKL